MGAIRVIGRAAIPDLRGEPAQAACLLDPLGRDPIQRGIRRGDRVAGGGAGRQADLAPDDPPAQLVAGDRVEIDIARQPEELVAAGDRRAEPVIVTR